MAAYPTNLPGPQVDGYAISPVDQTVRTDFEVGAARVRRRTRARNDVLDLSFVFNPAQFGTFRTWFESDAAGGATWFDIALDTGAGVATHEARFKGPWKAERSGTGWRITAQVEVR